MHVLIEQFTLEAPTLRSLIAYRLGRNCHVSPSWEVRPGSTHSCPFLAEPDVVKLALGTAPVKHLACKHRLGTTSCCDRLSTSWCVLSLLDKGWNLLELRNKLDAVIVDLLTI